MLRPTSIPSTLLRGLQCIAALCLCVAALFCAPAKAATPSLDPPADAIIAETLIAASLTAESPKATQTPSSDTPSLTAETQTPDSTAMAALDAKLDEYFAALNRESTATKCEEVDFIISSCTDSSVTAHVAGRVYDHYRNSKLMGDEAVAIHVFDRWFSDGRFAMQSPDTFMDAAFFARTNRSSLIGLKAPEITLYTPDMTPVSLPNPDGRFAILYFYDTGCATCLFGSIMLGGFLENHDYELDLYAVYIGSEAEQWKDYRETRFSLDAPSVRVFNLWDPDMESGLAVKYGVTSTPKMFLLDPHGTIIGRGLDYESLEQLLEAVYISQELEYGGDEAIQMYDKTFEDTSETDCGAVSDVAGRIAGMLLPRGDTLLYRQMTGDLLYYLTSRKEAKFKCGTLPFIDKYILGAPEIWTTADDTLKVVNLALFLKELMNLCPVGLPLPAIEIPATVLRRSGSVKKSVTAGSESLNASSSSGSDSAKTTTAGNPKTMSGAVKSKQTTVRLDKLKDCAIVFHTEGCPICRAEIAGARELLATGSPISATGTVPSRIILVDMDEIWNSGGTAAESLMQYFDLSSLPFIIALDSSGRVSHKYITLQK